MRATLAEDALERLRDVLDRKGVRASQEDGPAFCEVTTTLTSNTADLADSRFDEKGAAARTRAALDASAGITPGEYRRAFDLPPPPEGPPPGGPWPADVERADSTSSATQTPAPASQPRRLRDAGAGLLRAVGVLVFVLADSIDGDEG